MGLELFLLPLIVVGAVVAFRLRGAAGRRARKMLLFGFVASLGGCVASLSWLGAETSGRSNAVSEINPYLFLGLFVIGVLVMAAGAIVALTGRSEQKAAEAANARTNSSPAKH